MSGLRDSLGEWAAARGDEVAAATRVHEPATRAAIGRRRTRNLAATAGAAVLAVVAASTLAVAAPWKSAPPVAAGPDIDLGATGLECGAPWTLTEGTTTHDDSAPAYFGGVSGDWFRTTDNGEVSTNPQSLWAGYEVLSWKGDAALNGTIRLEATVVVEKDGVIVGSSVPDEDGQSTFDGSSITAYSPYPGECGGKIVVADSGNYTYHVVIEVTLLGEANVLLQTIVDPSGPLGVEVTGLESWGDPSGTSSLAELEEPTGEKYQAFLIAAPPEQSSCEPYTDILDNGEPAKTTPTYSVTIPGVQPLNGAFWGNQPVAIIEDEQYDAWYLAFKSGITAQSVDGGNPLGTLEWTTGPAVGETSHEGELRLVNTVDAIPPGPLNENCAFTAPIPTISGAVFLIIDGVDWETFDAQNPAVDISTTEGWQTWVYLGQAES